MTVPHYSDARVTVHHDDCLHVLAQMPDNSVDAIITDPPYGLANTTPTQVAETITAWISGDRKHIPAGRGFMGKSWDAFVPPVAVWDEALRVLKPGGHALVFAGSRTHDLMTLGLRLAGFQIRDYIAWIQGAGFPKSLNINKDARFCHCGPLPYSHADGELRGVRNGVSHTTPDAAPSEVPDVLAAVQREGSRPGVGDARAQRSSGLDGRVACVVPGEDDRRTEPGMARGRDAQAPEGQLHGGAVRPLPTGVRGDGAGGRLRGGAPAGDGPLGRSLPDADGVREPHQPPAVGQPAGEPGPLADESGSQARGVRPVCAGCGKPRIPQGLGTALKPANEPIVVARKPLQGTVAANVQQWGTGALNIDATRVGTGEDIASARGTRRSGGIMGASEPLGGWAPTPGQGRWPTNVALDGDAAAELDEQAPNVGNNGNNGFKPGPKYSGIYREGTSSDDKGRPGLPRDKGGASRFFPVFRYQAKAPTRERPVVVAEDGTKIAHNTVKPLALMRWLVRLVTPPDGLVLEPFAGSGTTVEAALLEGFRCVAIEREADYLPLIEQRITRNDPRRAAQDADDLTLFDGDVA